MRALLVAALGLLSVSRASTAAEVPATASVGLTLRAAIERALRENPELRAFGFALQAQEGRITQAGLGPNPELDVEFETLAGGGEEGSDAGEFTLALSQVVELGGKRSLRAEVAQAEHSVLEAEQRARQLDVLSEVVRRFIEVAAQQQQLALAHRAVELYGSTLSAVERRIQAGRSPAVEALRAQADLERARLEAARAEGNLATSRRRLAGLWGLTEPDFGTVAADLFALPAVRDFSELTALIDASPSLQRFLSEERLREAEMRLAQAQRRPDVALTGGVRRLEELNDQALVFGFSMPLPIFDRNQGTLRELAAERQRTRAEREARAIEARVALFGFYQELTQARREVEQLRTSVLPAVEKALKQTEYAYSRGRYSYLELIDAQRALLETHIALIEAAATYHALLADIEALTGESLGAGLPAQP